MTDLAIVAGLNVAGRFSAGDLIVMTCATRATHRRVIDAGNDIPMQAGMAGRAIGGGIDVIRGL